MLTRITVMYSGASFCGNSAIISNGGALPAPCSGSPGAARFCRPSLPGRRVTALVIVRPRALGKAADVTAGEQSFGTRLAPGIAAGSAVAAAPPHHPQTPPEPSDTQESQQVLLWQRLLRTIPKPLRSRVTPAERILPEKIPGKALRLQLWWQNTNLVNTL